ncbi:MAG TPA: hypothetical protein VFU05_00875 [Cyclobacteriaceae bacterium]|nr:hypothetical protein [Cyclobacteriaceae bacterium]
MIGFSIVLALLVAGISLIGIFTPDFYHRETIHWQIQSAGQDIIDLVLIVPILLLSTLVILRAKRTGMLLVAGVSLYLIYAFVIYAFDVHFNSLFFFYCLALGLSFYFFMYILSKLVSERTQLKTTKTIRKVIGTYFIVIAIIFYFLWLSEIIPASIANHAPASLMEVGLPTNPVHVLDLSIILPAILITGILLLKDKKMGHILTPIMLVFFVLMDITIGALNSMMLQNGLAGSITITVIMGALALLSFGLLMAYLSNQNTDNNLLPDSQPDLP